MNLLVVLKGGKGSGNFGHSGRHGKIGGSGVGGSLAGLNPEQLFTEQIAISDAAKDAEMKKFSDSTEATELKKGDLDRYLTRLGDHRRLILREAIKISDEKNLSRSEQQDLKNRLMKHDMDKYDWKTAEAYVGSFKTSRATYEGAFTAAMTNHHLKNDHHWEFHMTSPTRANVIPKMPYVEMLADWRGTAAERGTPQGAYYKKFGPKMVLHPVTRRHVEEDLGVKTGR